MSTTKVETLIQQLMLAHKIFGDTIAGITQEQVQFQPAGKAHSIAANYAHVLVQEDVVVSMLQNRSPLIATNFANNSGISILPPLPTDHLPNWDEWAREVCVDLSLAAPYSNAVFEQTKTLLTSISDKDLAQEIDTRFLGKMSMFELLNLTVLANCQWHTGEISVVKGLQELQGYPF